MRREQAQPDLASQIEAIRAISPINPPVTAPKAEPTETEHRMGEINRILKKNVAEMSGGISLRVIAGEMDDQGEEIR